MNIPRFILNIIAGALLLLAPTVAAVADERPFTVVIDAGHGGTDHGAIGKATSEKKINLAVTLELIRLIQENMPDVKVVATRTTDNFVTLQGRADIANRAQGDLFISIHTNSIDKKAKNYLTVAGASVYTLGFRRTEENLAVAMRENSVMKLEDDYSTVYEGFDPSSTESYIIFEMSQNKHMEQSIEAASAIQKELVSTAGRRDRGVRQANFWVLFKTGMPAVLVELDFICNPTQESFMKSDAGQRKLARAIYNGFADYKRADDIRRAAVNGNVVAKTADSKSDAKRSTKEQKKGKEETPTPKTNNKENQSPTIETSGRNSNTDDDVIYYKVQFLTSPTFLPPGSPKLKGLDAEYYRDGKIVKYTTGSFRTQQEAAELLRDVKKKFADAFIIKTKGGKRIK